MNPNYLDFEQPIAELEMKIEELQGVGAGADLKLIASIEKKELRDVRAPHAPNRSALTAH